MNQFTFRRAGIGVVAAALFLLPFSRITYAQIHSEVSLSNGQHVTIDNSRGGFHSVLIKDGKIQSIQQENPDAIVRLIITFKGQPLAAYQAQKSGLQKTSAASVYTTLQTRHASFVTALNTISQQLSAQMRSDYSYKITHDYYEALNGVSLQCKEGMIGRIQALPMVKDVTADREVKATLVQSVHQIHADIVRDSLGITGKGVLVGEIDTGIDYDNPALGGGFGPGYRVIGGYNFVSNNNNPMDDNGHGTHVAGIIGADGGDSLVGVAPDVKFLAVKVLDANGFGYVSDVIAGIDYCLDPDGNPATNDAVSIINMSLGAEPSADDPLDSAVANATKAGVLCVVAAGNSGMFGYGSILSPGTSASALTVGACDSADNIANFSSEGPDPMNSDIKPEVVAPGVNILSTILHDQTASWSGTSMATPHVTGTAALLKQEHPSWTPEEIKAVIINSAHSVGDSVSIFAQGKGCIDALNAAEERLVVEPGVMSFGYDDLAQAVWKDTVQLTIGNFHSTAQNEKISVVDGPPSGATLTFDKTSFSLAAGEETTVLAVLTVPSSVPVVSQEPFAYSGRIEVTSDSDNVVVPFSFIKSTTLVVSFDIPPEGLWIVDSAAGTIKQASLSQGSSKYIVPISQAESLDLLAEFYQDSLGAPYFYLVHRYISNPTGLTYVLVSHNEATINMAGDTLYDVHTNGITPDSASIAEVSVGTIVASGQKILSGTTLSWTFPFNSSKLFFTPLASSFYIEKLLIVSQDTDNYILRKTVYGLDNEQDVAIATGPNNLFGYHVIGSYHDAYLRNPSNWEGSIEVGMDTWTGLIGGWMGDNSTMGFPIKEGNFYFNKGGTDQVGNNSPLYTNYSYMDLGASFVQIAFDTLVQMPATLSTPDFTVDASGTATFAQMRITSPPTSMATMLPVYTYETVKSGDTISIEQYAHVNYPDHMTYLSGGSVFMRYNNDWPIYLSAYGGIKQFDGVAEVRSVFNSYWNMPLFTTQVFARDRVQANAKPFTPGEFPVYTGNKQTAYYEFDNMQNGAGTLRILSEGHAYTILGQAGQCTADFEYQIPATSGITFPSFNLLQVSVDGKAADMVRPDQTGTIRLIPFNPNGNITNVSMSLLLPSNREIDLPVTRTTKSGYEDEYDATIPGNIPAGFIDVVARVEDSRGDSCKLTASPGFYFGATRDSIRREALLRMSSYALNNVDDVDFTAGDTLNYSLSYANYGSATAKNVLVKFPTTPYFEPIGSDSLVIDSIGMSDTVKIPVRLIFLGKQQSSDTLAYYSPPIAWNSGGTRYLRDYQILADFRNTISAVAQTNNKIPSSFELYQNYPNPFNPSTIIKYDLPVQSKVRLVVYDILGRQVAVLVDNTERAGSHQVTWNAGRFASGVYFYRLQAGNYIATKKVLLLK